jgi:hypothetical protein
VGIRKYTNVSCGVVGGTRINNSVGVVTLVEVPVAQREVGRKDTPGWASSGVPARWRQKRGRSTLGQAMPHGDATGSWVVESGPMGVPLATPSPRLPFLQ